MTLSQPIPRYDRLPMTRGAMDPKTAHAEVKLLVREDAHRAKENPLDAWLAYLEAREAGLPVPEWVLAYLDAAAVRFRELCQHPPRDVRIAVAKTLGFTKRKRRLNPFRTVGDREIEQRDLALAFAVDRYQRTGRVGDGIDVYDSVANDSRNSRIWGFDAVGRSTVVRAWDKYQAAVEAFHST